jgi:hypothetical protein
LKKRIRFHVFSDSVTRRSSRMSCETVSSQKLRIEENTNLWFGNSVEKYRIFFEKQVMNFFIHTLNSILIKNIVIFSIFSIFELFFSDLRMISAKTTLFMFHQTLRKVGQIYVSSARKKKYPLSFSPVLTYVFVQSVRELRFNVHCAKNFSKVMHMLSCLIECFFNIWKICWFLGKYKFGGYLNPVFITDANILDFRLIRYSKIIFSGFQTFHYWWFFFWILLISDLNDREKRVNVFYPKFKNFGLNETYKLILINPHNIIISK